MEEDERKAIWYVLRELLREGSEWLRNHSSEGARNLGREYALLDERSLESHLKYNPHGNFQPGEVIQVEPPLREVRASALYCKWRFEGEQAGCRFYVGFWLDNDHFTGFRFESPEPGNHSYFHSQPCRSMGWEGPPVQSSALQMPERNPTWPLPAESSLELLLCLVLAIRGVNGLMEIKDRIEADGAMRQNRLLVRTLSKIAGFAT